jgi:hypothetical protein
MHENKLYHHIVKDLDPYKGKIYLVCCMGVEYDYDIDNHFIEYYKRLGIDEFLIILNTMSDGSKKLKQVQNILRNHGLEEKEIWVDYFHEHKKIKKMKDLVKDFTEPEDWIVMADSDEFYDYHCNLRKFISYCEKNKYDFAVGEIVDRLSVTGKPLEIYPDMNLFESFPIKSNLTNVISQAPCVKVVLNNSFVDISTGHHGVVSSKNSNVSPYPGKITVNHFKFKGNILENLKRRKSVLEKHGHGWSSFSENLLDYYDKNGTFL